MKKFPAGLDVINGAAGFGGYSTPDKTVHRSVTAFSTRCGDYATWTACGVHLIPYVAQNRSEADSCKTCFPLASCEAYLSKICPVSEAS